METLHLALCRGDQLVVLHTRGTCCHARHAPEAVIEVFNHLIINRCTVEGGAHEIDTTSGGVHLLAPEHKGGTRRKTKPTVHTVIDKFLRGRVVLVERAKSR